MEACTYHDLFSSKHYPLFFHTMPGYCLLTPGWYNYYPRSLPTPVALAPMLSHIPNYFRMTTTTQLDKLPLSNIIFRTTDNTNVFNNYKTCLKEIQLLVQQVSIVTALNETLPFYFRFETTNICYFRTYVYKC